MKTKLTKEQMGILEELKGEDIGTYTATILKSWAKELKIKNWWELKKVDLVTEIQNLFEEYTKPVEEIKPLELTKLEKEIMAAIPEDNFYENELDSIIWTDCFLDSIKMDNKKARGVLSSLKQKGLLDLYSTTEKDGGESTYSTLSLTDLGKTWMTEYLEKANNETEEEEDSQEEVEDENLITLKEIISELGIKGTKARRILRNSDIDRPYKRWEWHKEEHKEIIEKVKGLLK